METGFEILISAQIKVIRIFHSLWIMTFSFIRKWRCHQPHYLDILTILEFFVVNTFFWYCLFPVVYLQLLSFLVRPICFIASSSYELERLEVNMKQSISLHLNFPSLNTLTFALLHYICLGYRLTAEDYPCIGYILSSLQPVYQGLKARGWAAIWAVLNGHQSPHCANLPIWPFRTVWLHPLCDPLSL